MSAACYCTSPATTGQLCTPHASQLRQDLARTPRVLADLDVTLTGQARQGGNSGNGERWAFNPTASDRADDVLVVLRSAVHIADPRAVHRYDDTARALASRALAGVRVLMGHPDVHTVAQDLRDGLDAAERATDVAPERIVYGPCSCGVELSAPAGAEVTWCRGCGGRHELAQVQAERYEQVREWLSTAVGTLAQITEWLRLDGFEVSARTVEKWPARRNHTLIGCVQEGAPRVYSYRQARALAERHRGRVRREVGV